MSDEAEAAAHTPGEFTLEARGLTKAFRSRVVVSNVDVRVESGEVVGLLGPNGAGKTTSFYMIVGLLQPDSGTIALNGDDVTALPMYQRARRGVNYLPQEQSIFRKLTVEQNVLAILENLGLGAEAQAARLEELLAELDLARLRDSQAQVLSGGEKRRLEITRALVTDPTFILLDEPFAGVDPIAILDIQTIIGTLRDRGIGVLITDHNVRETLKICDHAYLIHEGRIQVKGTAEEIVADPVARRVYLGEDFEL